VRAAAPGRTVTVIDLSAAPPPPRPSTGGIASGSAEEPTTDTAALPRRRGGGTGRGGGSGPNRRSLLRRAARPVPAPRAAAGEAALPAPLSFDTEAVGPAISLPPVVLGDENRIRQIVANLLGNARRFTADDSPIEITVGTDPSRIGEHAPIGMGWIAISDHGEGIPEQIRSSIFERFWRADTSRTRETGGTGLGLAIVASIVDALHGAVEVDDTPGGGATFRVYLPLAREATLYLDTQPLPKFTAPSA
jgi:two-component system OmpR family sensor kinase